MNKHTITELKDLQALPLADKVQLTKDRIREFYRAYNGAVYVSFSGGKDSTALLHIRRSIYPGIEALFCDTGLEYPEVRDFVKTFDNVTWQRPKMNFKQVVKKYGYPVISKEISHKVNGYKAGKEWAVKFFENQTDSAGNLLRYRVPEKWKYLKNAPFDIAPTCCDIMKKGTAHRYERKSGNKAIVGTLAAESMLRTQKWLQNGCNAFDGKNPKSTPLRFWTNQDILQYLNQNKIKIAEIYGDIVQDSRGLLHTTKAQRTGCMFCRFGRHLEKAPNRFQQMQLTHPKQWDYCMRPLEQGGLGMAAVLNYIGIEYEQKQITLTEIIGE